MTSKPGLPSQLVEMTRMPDIPAPPDGAHPSVAAWHSTLKDWWFNVQQVLVRFQAETIQQSKTATSSATVPTVSGASSK